MEPVPNPDSRVTLSSKREQAKLNQPKRDWRLTEPDKQYTEETYQVIPSVMKGEGLL